MQLWALVSDDNTYSILMTSSADEHPADVGHAEDCEGLAVWPLKRRPDSEVGERVDQLTGKIMFDPHHRQPGQPQSALERAIAAIKSAAGREIEGFAPLWRQLNDARSPEDPAVLERMERIDQVRARSNDLEAQAAAAHTASQLRAVWDLIQR